MPMVAMLMKVMAMVAMVAVVMLVVVLAVMDMVLDQSAVVGTTTLARTMTMMLEVTGAVDMVEVATEQVEILGAARLAITMLILVPMVAMLLEVTIVEDQVLTLVPMVAMLREVMEVGGYGGELGGNFGGSSSGKNYSNAGAYGGNASVLAVLEMVVIVAMLLKVRAVVDTMVDQSVVPGTTTPSKDYCNIGACGGNVVVGYGNNGHGRGSGSSFGGSSSSNNYGAASGYVGGFTRDNTGNGGRVRGAYGGKRGNYDVALSGEGNIGNSGNAPGSGYGSCFITFINYCTHPH